MNTAQIVRASSMEGQPQMFLRRLYIPRSGAKSLLLQADVSSIAWKVYNTSTGTLVNSGTSTVSAVIYDTLQTGTLWDVTGDRVGYNFAVTLAASNFPDGGITYRIEFTIALVSSQGNIIVPYELTTVDTTGE